MGKKIAFLLLLSLPFAAQSAPFGTDEKGDKARYQLSIRVAQDAFLQLHRAYGARWRVAMTLELCGMEGLAQSLRSDDAGNKEVADAIQGALKKNGGQSASPLTQTEFMMIHGAVANIISSYQIGYKEGTVLALQREPVTGALCGMAVETAALLGGKKPSP